MNEYDNDLTAESAVKNLYEGRFDFVDTTTDKTVPILIKASMGDGFLNIQNLETGGPFQIPHPTIPGAKVQPDALTMERVAAEGRLIRVHKVKAGVFLPEYDDDEAAALDPRAKMKRDVVRALVLRGVGGGDPKLSRHITEVWNELGFQLKFGDRPDTRTIRDCFEKGDPTTISVAELMSRSGKVKRKSRLHPEVEPLVDASAEHFYDVRGHRLRDCEAHLTKALKAKNKDRSPDDQLKKPSRETLRKRIGELLTRERYEKKHGKAAADRHFGGAGIGLGASRIGQLGAMDDTALDGIACFDAARGLPAGRPNLCLIVDVASRCIVGYFLSFSGPSANTALETIKAANAYNRVPKELLDGHPILERINCLFEEIVVDRGSNYTSLAFGQALLDVGTTLRFARLRRARDKAIVERIFRTLSTFLLEKLPGATYAPKLMREFGYDPAETACLTIGELRELIEYFIAVYHLTVHSSIGIQPALFWKKSLEAHGRHLMTDGNRFGILLGETIYGVQLHRWGFSLNGIRYTHPNNVEIALTRLCGPQAVGTTDDYDEAPTEHARTSTGRRRKSRSAGLGNTGASANVKVKRNTANLLTVHAYVPDHGWLEFEAANAAYADGLSLHQHEQIGKWAKARNMAFSTEEEQLAARAALIERVNELAPDMPLRDRRSVARMLQGDASGQPRFTIVEEDEGGIAAEPCDERQDPEPSRAKQRAENRDPADLPTKAENAAEELRRRLQELQGLGWSSPAADDELMEEHA